MLKVVIFKTFVTSLLRTTTSVTHRDPWPLNSNPPHFIAYWPQFNRLCSFHPWSNPFSHWFLLELLYQSRHLQGSPQNSLALYLWMLRNSAKLSNVTYPFVLKSCSTLSLVFEGEHIHTHVLRLGFGSDLFVWFFNRDVL